MLTTETANLNLTLRYSLGAWTLRMNATHLFQHYGARQQTTTLNQLHSYWQDIRIPSMRNMIGISVSWNFATGRKHQAGHSSIHNADSDTGIVKF